MWEDLVLGAFVNAFRTPDLRRKLLFVLGIIVVFRVGSVMPAPGVNVANVGPVSTRHPRRVEGNNVFNLINAFSGGALLQLTVFALGIMPYITASIILQLLTVVIPDWRPSRRRASPARRRSPSTRATSRSDSPCCRPRASWPWPATNS
jgi:preprotein translocase subunit SecY